MDKKKSLYQEAVLDALQVKELAIKEAQNNVIDALTPRIREFVEKELLMPSDEECVDSEECIEVTPIDAINVIADEQPIQPKTIETLPDVPPVPVAQEFNELDQLDPILVPLVDAIKLNDPISIATSIIDVVKQISRLQQTTPSIKETKTFNRRINRLSNGLENIYGYVQSTVSNSELRSKVCEQLDKNFNELKQLREEMMKNKKQLREDNEQALKVDTDTTQNDDKKTVSLNIDVPTDLANQIVDALGDIEISLEDEDESAEEATEETTETETEESSEEVPEEATSEEETADDETVEIVDDEEENKEELQLNGRQFSDDTIVEIDESVLQNELKRLRSIKEACSTGAVQGVAAKDEVKKEDDEEILLDKAEATKKESIERSLARESRIQRIAKLNGSRLQKEGAVAKQAKDAKRYAQIKASYLTEVKNFNESVERVKQLTGLLSEITNVRSNSDVKASSTRTKLAETNLNNVKLQYANKLLSTQNISTAEKYKIVESLEAAKTVDEAKTIYESSVKSLTAKDKSKDVVSEGVGSASRISRSSGVSKQINEGIDVARWQLLAGIK